MTAGASGSALGGPLHGVRHPGAVTAAGALAWFAGSGHSPAGQVPREAEAIGYLLAPGRAEWFRCAGGIARGPEGPRELAGVFEMFVTDGLAQVRWLHEADGSGRAVCLSEDAAVLPGGESLPGGAERRRLEGTADRLLAGKVSSGRPGDGWATLATARYSPCEVPVNASPGQRVWARFAEYAAADEHGNLSVTDAVLFSLAARDDDAQGRAGQGGRP